MGMPTTDMFGKPWANQTQNALQQKLGPAPAGFDQKNWDDPTMDSVKYAAGRMLYGKSKPSEVGGVVGGADFQKRFPGATFDGKDRVNFQGALSDGTRGGVPVYDIDVLQGADKGADASNGLWWGHDVPGMNQGPVSNTMPVGAPAKLGQSDLMAQILEALQQEQQPDPQMLLQQAMR